ncbi:MAG: hypothetical protein WC615_15370 [Mucilaginibacter sp.]|jgi:hypothetical protein|uniref:DUF7079 family protein n=1 Tax=Mucilaginibacter sp. TaxID=1882438 RepID=UPI00356780A4
MNIEKSYQLYQRRPVWIALSQFYLDTELDDLQLLDILKVIYESPYSIDEVKKIDFFEVYPVLKFNTYDPAGEWEGFDEDWLIDKIEKKIIGDKIFSRKLSGLRYWWAKKFTKDYWQKLDRYWNKLDQFRNKIDNDI